MKYVILNRPHANSRYQEGVLRLSCAETANMLRRFGVDAPVDIVRRMGADFLEFEADALHEPLIRCLSAHSHLMLLFEGREDGSLVPLAGQRAPYLREDLPFVQKYKGKTNEAFTMHLINQAHMASAFWQEERLSLLDPMCGRGTTLFQAVNRGFCATGAEIHGAEAEECGAFFKRYLEFHHIKHSQKKRSLTLNGKGVPLNEFSFAGDAEAYKAGDVRTLQLLTCDSVNLQKLMPRTKYHLMVADLPSGVQHAPGAQGKRAAPFEETLENNLRVWRELLLPGGAMALSFNVNTLPTARVRELMERCGLLVCRGEGYDGLEHWVEQAITRDAAVAVRPA